MKINIQAQDFKKALDAVMDICPSRAAHPAFSCVHLQTGADSEGHSHVILSCQDGTVEIRRWLRCNVVEAGECLVQAKLLRDYVNVMPGELTLSCENAEGKCLLTAGRRKATIPCLPADEYHYNASYLLNKQLASISPEELSRFVSTCAHCAGTDMSRLALTGLLLEFENGVAKGTCTDAYTFAHVESPAIVFENASLLIPITALQKAAKLLSDSESDIVVSGGTSLCRMDGDVSQITFSLLSATYVDYRRLMHHDAPTTVTVSCRELLSCVRQCSIAANDNQKGCVTVNVENNRFTVRAASSSSETVTQMDCAQYGVAVEAAFNGRYLTEALDRVLKESDRATLLFKGKTSPCAVIPETSDERKPFAPYFLVLPVRTLPA